MLNQLFSIRNFRDIYDVENRKGNNIDYLFQEKTVKDKTTEIKNKTKEKKGLKGEKREKIIKEINDLKVQKENLLIKELQKIITKIDKEKNTFTIKLGNIVRGKQTFELEKKPENFFISKQIQYNLKKVFKINISSRNCILSQLNAVLDDKLPKYIIRTDIKNFYETIPHIPLLKLIENNEILNTRTKYFIKQLIRQYESMGYKQGIPRGIGISAYLSEIYLKHVDEEILKQNNMIYYARYVDDIVLVLAKDSDDNPLEHIKQIIGKKSLTINEDKTIIIDTSEKTNKNLTFLGYDIDIKNFEDDNDEPHIIFSLSNKKYMKYKNRITTAFDIYERSKNKKNSAKNLYDRIKFLTSNTKLLNNKSNVLTGIYYSNIFLNDTTQLDNLDNFLKEQINKINKVNIQQHFKDLSFKKGFAKQIFVKYTTTKLEEITKIWKYEK